MGAPLYDIHVTTISGEERSLADYADKVLLIVNTASKCGFTPQYEGLEQLYRCYRDRGFEVLGFPCNQFGGQEPGTESEIQAFCQLNYQVDFPLFAKLEVNGENAHPLYRFLKGEARGLLGSEAIKWNFTKFLVNRQGEVVKRFAPATLPSKLATEIEAIL
ncbi:MAG: Glutathione peroxidase [Holophagaceae bacterium]|nr:Glutathione peroxidase [Holophagaceae bacterium]